MHFEVTTGGALWVTADSSRPALPAGSHAAIELTRLPLCNEDQWIAAQKAVKLWLILGTLGLRSARAAGSVWPIDDLEKPWVPKDAATLKSLLVSLGLERTSIALVGEGMKHSYEKLRTTASDTVSDRQVFGAINDRAGERAPSPTRFKVIRMDDGYCLLANSPRNSPSMLCRAEQLLNSKPQPDRWTALGPWNHLIC